MADYLLLEPGFEVHVDVGEFCTARLKEPLEQQVVFDRVHIGDVHEVGDQ